jgi:hypothetical protein
MRSGKARLRLTLDDVLVIARRLHEETGKPIVILMRQQLDSLEAHTYEDWVEKFTTTPEQVRSFQAATTLIASLRPAISDESFDVYVLK